MAAMSEKIIFIVGPTGSGKTELGLRLSKILPCEFISADSMQIYKGMDIITDKLPEVIRKSFPCHLVDIIPPGKEYNVADFYKAARKAIKGILRKKKLPVVIGGTGLYVNSLLYGIFQAGRNKSQALRAKLENTSHKKGIGFLYEELKKVDPHAAAKINPKDTRRIIRALEVYTLTGKPISVLQKEKKGLIADYQVRLFGLRRNRGDLYGRIEQRVDSMIQAGALNEVAKLSKKKLSKTAYCCIGVRELEGYLKSSYDLKEAIRLMKRNTRHFAKRQMTWFNKNKDIEWFDVKGDDDLSAIAKEIVDRVKSETKQNGPVS